jgi:type IV pilus assembly protein PilM
MAEIRGVWGIDIGLAGLKAIRLVYAEAAKQVLTTAFDYVAHPKILSQPDANPEELIGQALDTFLSRNKIKGDGVAICVPGQTALTRFIQLPPVESSKVAEIVKYEARQQIPFALEEVIWDFQTLGVGMEESGFLLDAEVGLFAMKRDQVQQHLRPFLQRKVEVDLVQVAPLALYNFLCHDQYGQAPGTNAPPEQEGYTLVLDMGADNTTLLVSNGNKLWIRNVPLGGNHFTRALTKEMKLTFAKAEHLKCNATKSPDPKAVFQALRPIFNDYVAEIQRSIGYFSSVNRDAKITKIVGVGSGFKLAGLQKFLQQNLQMDVERVDHFPGLAGDTVLNAPLFQENLLSFAVPYGAALQGLKLTRIHTSLLPPEITTARMIRKKKPWAVATAATVLAGLSISTMGYAHVWSTSSTARFGKAEDKAKLVVQDKGAKKTAYDSAVTKNQTLKTDLEQVLSPGKGRTSWLELYKAINECLPRDIGDQRDIEDPTKKNRIRIFSITAKKYTDLGQWYNTLPQTAKVTMRAGDQTAGPTGAGYVFTLDCRHFHHEEDNPAMQDVPYVQNTLLKNLQSWEVLNGDSPTGKPMPVRKLGISHAAIIKSFPSRKVLYYKDGTPYGPMAGGAYPDGTALNPMDMDMGGLGTGLSGRPASVVPGSVAGRKILNKRAAAAAAAAAPAVEGTADPNARPIPLTKVIIQFAWVETPESKRPPADPASAAAAGDPAAAAGTAPAAAPAAALPENALPPM